MCVAKVVRRKAGVDDVGRRLGRRRRWGAGAVRVGTGGWNANAECGRVRGGGRRKVRCRDIFVGFDGLRDGDFLQASMGVDGHAAAFPLFLISRASTLCTLRDSYCTFCSFFAVLFKI